MSSKPEASPSEAPGSPQSSQLPSLPAAPSPQKKSLLDHFPPWVATNIRSTESRKMLLRCWLGSWAALVLMLPDKSLKTMGNSCVSCLLCVDCWTVSTAFRMDVDLHDSCRAFFAFLISLLLPPMFPVQFFFFVSWVIHSQ